MYTYNQIPVDFVVQYKDRRKWSKFEDFHTHDCYEFYYLLEGDLTFYIGEEEYRMKKGSLAMLPPGLHHKSKPNSDPKHRRILLYVKETFVKEFIDLNPEFMDCFNKPHIQLMKIQQKRIENLLDQVMNEYYRDDESRDMVIVKSLLGLILSYINRYNSENENFSTAISEGNLPSGKITEAVKHINEFYGDDITLASTAQALGINPSYLSRSFKSAMSCNFSDYLTNVRINHAVNLLLNSDKNITEIAFEVGYNSSNHFCKAFRKVMGISPLRYRKRS